MRNRLVVIICSMLVASVLAYAQAPPAKPKPPGEDWVQLFNGKDFTGWNKVGQEDWQAVDGVIVGKAASKAYGYLETAKDYKDFELHLRFKCVGTGNSGVPALLRRVDQTLASLQQATRDVARTTTRLPQTVRNVEEGTANLPALLTQTQQTTRELEMLLTQLRGLWLLGGGGAPAPEPRRPGAERIRP